MPRTNKNRWLVLAGGVVAMLLTSFIPARANAADAVTICVNNAGKIKGLFLVLNGSCPGGTQSKSWVLEGSTGAQGPTGVGGVPGAKGPQGLAGALGPQGPTGAQGDQGQPGVKGPQGQTGAQGPTGTSGVQGTIGQNGKGGPTGPTGATGPQGAQGEEGPPNLVDFGPTGVTGAQGPTGPMGDVGEAGNTGFTGAVGATGANTEDEVFMAGGTLGSSLGNFTNIELTPDIAFLIMGMGNGSNPESLTPAQTYIPIPGLDGSGNFATGVLEDLHVHIDSPPGNGGAYTFTATNLTTGQSNVVCTILDSAPPITSSNGCEVPNNQCCTDSESSTGNALLVHPFDNVAISAVGAPIQGKLPVNDVSVTYSIGYVHCDGGDAACPPGP